MNHKQPTLYLEQLENDRLRLLQKLADLRQELKVEVEIDDDDSTSDLMAREEVLGRIRRLERTLETLDHTMQQARAGRYGICERCGQTIDPERLEIVPETTFCVECKRIEERKTRSGQWSPAIEFFAGLAMQME